MRLCIILPSVACLILQHFSTLSQNRQDFRKKFSAHKICILIFSISLSETLMFVRTRQRDIIINVRRFSRTVAVIFVRF